VRYLQRPLEDGHGAPQVSFIGFSGNLGYKVKTVKRITLDPYLGISVYPLIWNNRNPLVGGDYFSLKIGVKLGFIQKRNSFKNSGTPRFKQVKNSTIFTPQLIEDEGIHVHIAFGAPFSARC
jgi:hypothetical protein